MDELTIKANEIRRLHAVIREMRAEHAQELAEIKAHNDSLRASLAQATDELSHLTSVPLPWTLRLSDQYLKSRLSLEDAKAWGEILSRTFHSTPIAVVTA